MDTVVTRAVDVIVVRTKRIYTLIIIVDLLFSFFSSLRFLKEIENVFSLFLSSYRNIRESVGELKKTVRTQHFSFSQTSTRVSITR